MAAGTLDGMPGALPDGEPVPADGSLPAAALRGRRRGAASASTCTCRSAPAAAATATSTPTPPTELGGGASRAAYADTVLAELALAARVLGGAAPPVDTVFFGGGTPTLLPPDDLARILDGDRQDVRPGRRRRGHHRGQPRVGRRRRRCGALRAAGFTRISLGMQSAAPHVLARAGPPAHRRAGRAAAAAEAREAGFDHVNLDLIYGTPGETAGRLRRLAATRSSAPGWTTSRRTR